MFFFWKKSHNRLYAIFKLIRISCFYIVDIYNIYTIISLPSQTTFPATEIHLCFTFFTTATHIPFVKRLKVFILHF